MLDTTADPSVADVTTDVLVRFHVYAGPDPLNSKSTMLFLKSIQKCDFDKIYQFPPELQPLRSHLDVSRLAAVTRAGKALKARGHHRRIIVSLTPTLFALYFDADGMARYNSKYLEEWSDPLEVDALLPEAVLPDPKMQTLQSIAKNAEIEKFNGFSRDPEMWLANLERECRRLDIPTDRYCEVLRLFLEGTARDWFNATWSQEGTQTWNWDRWKTSFLVDFAKRDRPIQVYAVNYKYLRIRF